VRPRRWWTERHILARRALDDGEVTTAYRLAADHGQTSAAAIAEAEWLAGWVALRFLGEPILAYRHFVAMHRVVRMPISVARAAYWAGRAAEAAAVPLESERWYRRAVTRPTTFYGQLATLALGREVLTLPAGPHPAAAGAFEARELVRLARLLGELDEGELMGAVLARLLDQASSPAERALIAHIGLDYGLAHVSIRAAKRALRDDTMLIESAYPVPAALAPGPGGAGLLEPGLLLALARQESEMNRRVVSRAGARGLLQLMPATARMMARRLGLTYERSRLTSDDAYNLRLGGGYLAGLLADFDGAGVLALPAYNAGPGRVGQWIRDNGDPRDAAVDPIDWIELIPYSETRNYVQRVLEGIQVYRHLLADPARPPRLRLAEDMIGKPGRLAKR
jgi:soluble lytic murein transglycosylase